MLQINCHETMHIYNEYIVQIISHRLNFAAFFKQIQITHVMVKVLMTQVPHVDCDKIRRVTIWIGYVQTSKHLEDIDVLTGQSIPSQAPPQPLREFFICMWKPLTRLPTKLLGEHGFIQHYIFFHET